MSETMKAVGGAIMNRTAAVLVFVAGIVMVGASMIDLAAVKPFENAIRYMGDGLLMLSGLRGILGK